PGERPWRRTEERRDQTDQGAGERRKAIPAHGIELLRRTFRLSMDLRAGRLRRLRAGGAIRKPGLRVKPNPRRIDYEFAGFRRRKSPPQFSPGSEGVPNRSRTISMISG